jgi:hypothetical protein
MRARLVIVLASLASGLAPAQAAGPSPDEAMLKISYSAALGRCDGELVLYPDGRFEASARFSDKAQYRAGRQDPVYWDLATGVLEVYGFRRIESVNSYYNTIAPDEAGATEKLAELERKTAYIIVDGWTYRIDWRDEDGERHYLMEDSRAPVSPMIKQLLREVQFEKRTCGYYFQPMP